MSPLTLELPSGPRAFHHLVLDFTGTLSVGGTLLPGVAERLRALSASLQITVVTADTFGFAREAVRDLPVDVQIIGDGEEKARVVAGLAREGVVGVGNGRNDIPMMAVAGLSIAVLGPEGTASGLLEAADVVVRDINDALDLLLHPLRLKATLRD